LVKQIYDFINILLTTYYISFAVAVQIFYRWVDFTCL